MRWHFFLIRSIAIQTSVGSIKTCSCSNYSPAAKLKKGSEIIALDGPSWAHLALKQAKAGGLQTVFSVSCLCLRRPNRNSYPLTQTCSYSQIPKAWKRQSLVICYMIQEAIAQTTFLRTLRFFHGFFKLKQCWRVTTSCTSEGKKNIQQ